MSKYEAIKKAFPDIDWDMLGECDRALNWELYHAPLPDNYWTEVEPLEKYVWKGWVQATEDIREMLKDMPSQIYYDMDADLVTDSNPEDDHVNWATKCEYCKEWVRTYDDKEWFTFDEDTECSMGDRHEPGWLEADWIGYEYEVINPIQEVLHAESYNHTY